ncbi:MAG: CoA-binding protein [Chloroflexi bacterium]|nr:CoA-binding protein [Chloroflexota bacterium]
MIISDNDAAKRDLLTKARVIAVVGHSDKPDRESYKVGMYLRNAGYTVYPVNPAVTEIDGQPSYASLADVPEAIDIVDVFRRPENLPEIVDEAAAVGAKAVWAQLDVVHEEAARKAAEAGLDVVMDYCIKIEHARLLG